MSGKLKVLIIEDDKYILKAMALKFSDAGFAVRLAPSAEAAWEILKIFIPGVIILDLLLPGIDGYQFLSRVKNSPKFKHIPVIIASNLDSREQIKKAIDLEAAEFIVKSELSLDELVSKAKLLLRPDKE